VLVLVPFHAVFNTNTRGGNTVDIYKRLSVRVPDVMKGIRRYVTNFAPADFKGSFLFAD
jgi:hypothetical protein